MQHDFPSGMENSLTFVSAQSTRANPRMGDRTEIGDHPLSEKTTSGISDEIRDAVSEEKKEIKEALIKEWIKNDKVRSIFIYGESGVGKSTWYRYFKHQIDESVIDPPYVFLITAAEFSERKKIKNVTSLFAELAVQGGAGKRISMRTAQRHGSDV